MKLFLLQQSVNNDYDTYDSCVVCAENEEDAKTITPRGNMFGLRDRSTWAYSLTDIECREIGIANPNEQRGVIIASFNAG